MRFAAVLSLIIAAAGAHASDSAVAYSRLSLNVTPGATVAVIAALNEPRGTHSRYERVATVVRDDDRDGVVVYDLGRPIPPRSIWAWADVGTGKGGVVTPIGYPRRTWLLGPEKIKNLPADQFDELQHDHLVLQVLWVRGGEGAWVLDSSDGGANDVDGANDGGTTVTTAAFTRLGDSPAPPKKIKKGDLLLLIDPFEMSFAQEVVSR